MFLADPDSFELLPDDRVVRFVNGAGLVLQDPSAISYVQCKTIGFYVIPDLKSLENASEAERDDRQVVLRAVEAAGFELRYASERLRGDYELVEAAVEQDGLVMGFGDCIPEQFRQDPRIRLAAVKSNRLAFCVLTGHLRLPANDGWNEADSPDIVRSVLTAPAKTNDALIALLHPLSRALVPRLKKFPPLWFASDRLKADPDFVVEAMQHSCDNLFCAAQALKNDPNFIRRCIDTGATEKRSLEFFALLGPAVQTDRAVILHYIRRHGDDLHTLPENLQSDPEFLLAALESHPYWLPFLSEEVRADRRFVKTAFRPFDRWLTTGTKKNVPIKRKQKHHLRADDSHLLACVSSKLKQDPSFVRELLDQDCGIIAPMLDAGKYALEPELILQFVRDCIKAMDTAEQAETERRLSEFCGINALKGRSRASSAKAAEDKDATGIEIPDWFDFESRFLVPLLKDVRFNEHRGLLLVVLPILGQTHPSCLDVLRGSKDRELALAVFQKETVMGRELALLVMEKLWGYRDRPHLFQYLSAELRDDLELAKCAVADDPEMFRFASERLRGDTNFAETVVKSKPVLYTLMQGAARHDRGVVLAAFREGRYWSKRLRPFCVTSEPRLVHLPVEYRDDREVVLLAVGQNGLNLQYASNRLRGDWGVVEAACAERKYSRGRALVFASDSLKSDSAKMAELYAKVIVEGVVAKAVKVVGRKCSGCMYYMSVDSDPDSIDHSDGIDSDAEGIRTMDLDLDLVNPHSDDARFGRDRKSLEDRDTLEARVPRGGSGYPRDTLEEDRDTLANSRARDRDEMINAIGLENEMRMREIFTADEYQKALTQMALKAERWRRARVFSIVKPSPLPPALSMGVVGSSETGTGTDASGGGAASSSSAAVISSGAAGTSARKRNAGERDAE